MTLRSKAWVCGRSLLGIAGSNRTGGMDICLLRVLCAVRSLCEGPITRPKESECVCVCVCVCLCVIDEPHIGGLLAPVRPSGHDKMYSVY